MMWWQYNDVREVETVAGCFSLVRKEAIEQVGVMDELYFVYGDDPDWCYRFHKADWKIMFTPEAQIIHYGRQTTKKMPRKFLFQRFGSRLIFMKLHKSRLTFQFTRILTALFFLLRVPYWLAVAMLDKNESKNSIQTARTYLIGGFYCLTDWRRLLMNDEEVRGKL